MVTRIDNGGPFPSHATDGPAFHSSGYTVLPAIGTEKGQQVGHPLKRVAAELRASHPAPVGGMLVKDYQLAATIHALADALDKVADQ